MEIVCSASFISATAGVTRLHDEWMDESKILPVEKEYRKDLKRTSRLRATAKHDNSVAHMVQLRFIVPSFSSASRLNSTLITKIVRVLLLDELAEDLLILILTSGELFDTGLTRHAATEQAIDPAVSAEIVFRWASAKP